MKKRLTSFLLYFFMCVALIPVSAQATETAEANAPEIPTEGDVWDGTITEPSKLVEIDGIYYYEISKCAELAYVAQQGGQWLSRNYILMDNLIFNTIELQCENGNLTVDTKALKEWIPIQTLSGSFNGNGCIISGLYCNQPSSSYVGLIGASAGGSISNLTIVNSFLCGKNCVGGICGTYENVGADILNCTFAGYIIGSNCVGGICGTVHCIDIDSCKNYGEIRGNNNVGGIVGYKDAYDITNCINYGDVIGVTSVGGIVGKNYYPILYSQNNGSVAGITYVGGIVGSATRQTTIAQVCNTGQVVGEQYVGGVLGFDSAASSELWIGSSISNSYNAGAVLGTEYVGGISGNSVILDTACCYNIGSVSGSSYVGGVQGTTEAIWGQGTLIKCYYLKSTSINKDVVGVGNLTEDYSGTIAADANAMQTSETYVDWNFTDVWSISADKNGGYPYLQWQEDVLSDIAVNNVAISETSLSLVDGDYAYLTATVSPANASDKSVTWKSSNSDIATVSAAGKVTAVSAGTATITATTEDGNYTATCTVTVTARISEEYKINSITIRDNDGATLSTIPIGTSLATVSITNLASEGNTLVYLAAYTSTGQYQGMMWVSVEDLPVDATIKVTLPVDNSDGKIANLKAFTVASFSNLTPLGEAVSFLP